MTKYIYYRVIQGMYDGRTWDDVDFHETDSDHYFRTPEDENAFKTNWRAYLDNEPQYPHRWVRRRELRQS